MNRIGSYELHYPSIQCAHEQDENLKKKIWNEMCTKRNKKAPKLIKTENLKTFEKCYSYRFEYYTRTTRQKSERERVALKK